MSESVPQAAKRISTFVVAVITITLILSILSIYISINEFLNGNDMSAGYFLMIGFLGLAFSAYMMFQTRQRISVSLKTHPVLTTLSCTKCGFKSIREFKRGDYVFKQSDESCPKCNEKMLVAAIYREVREEKEKKSRFS